MMHTDTSQPPTFTPADDAVPTIIIPVNQPAVDTAIRVPVERVTVAELIRRQQQDLEELRRQQQDLEEISRRQQPGAAHPAAADNAVPDSIVPVHQPAVDTDLGVPIEQVSVEERR